MSYTRGVMTKCSPAMRDQTEAWRIRVPYFALLSFVVFTGCSNGSGDSQRTENTLPTIQLDDGQVLGNGNSIVRIPASDDTGIVSVSSSLLRQGKLDVCESRIDLSLTSNSLVESCLADQPTCSVEFIPSPPDEVIVYPPPLYAPIGLEYELTFIDRDGAVTDPVNTVFCFDVGINSPPVPAADTYQLVFPSTIQRTGVIYDARCEKQPGSDGVLFNDDDDEHVTNTCLRAELVDAPQFATNRASFRDTFEPNGAFRYEGLTNAPASDSFTYRVTDGINPPSAPIRVDIVFSGGNQPPIAVDDEFTFTEDSDTRVLDVLSNDSDPDALPLTIIEVNNGPVAGTATIRNGVIVDYRPNEDFNGNDSFNYVIRDSVGITASATVQIRVTPVNDSPVAVNDEAEISENTAIAINVIANDSDPDGDEISVIAVTDPVNGTATIEPGGLVLYTPNLNYFGIDTFEYTVEDSDGATDTATARIIVNMDSESLRAVDDAFTTSVNRSIVVDVLANDIGGDGDDLELFEIEQPRNGTTTIAGGNIRYTPNENYTGVDTFNYTVTDGDVTAEAEVTITITLFSTNGAPIAADDSVTISELTATTISVLENDLDPDGDPLTIAIISQPDNGAAVVSGDEILYTPDSDFSGTDELIYSVSDGNGGTDSAVVSITVSIGNRPPVAVDDFVTTEQGDRVRFTPLANDSDPDGDRISLQSATEPLNGTLQILGSSNRIIYSPAALFTGSDSFEYTISDDRGSVSTATVTITVVLP